MSKKHSKSIEKDHYKDLLFRLDYKGKQEALVLPDADIVFNYAESYLQNGMIAP